MIHTYVIKKGGFSRIMRVYPNAAMNIESGEIFEIVERVTPVIFLLSISEKISEKIEASDSAWRILFPTADDVISKWRADDQGQVTGARKIDEDDIPAFPDFKDAWEDDGSIIATDMPKARLIKMDRIRIERDARLSTTDKEVLQLENAALPAALKSKRKALRDLPQNTNLDIIDNPEELKLFNPVWP